MTDLRSAVLAALTLVAAPAAALADTIFLVDGTSIEDVRVKAETLSAVEYGSKTVDSAKVLRVEYAEKPSAIDEAELLASDGDIDQAVLDLFYFVDGAASRRPDARFAWAPAFAAQRRIELLRQKNDLAGVVEAANLLIERFPESRYVPGAYLEKAGALTLGGNDAAAAKVLAGLVALSEDQALSPRYRLSAEVQQAAIDPSIEPAQRIERLQRLSGQAGNEFPTVRDRAYLAQGELHVLIGETEDDVASHVADAREMFDRVLASESGEDSTRAGALAGLGDCDFAVATRSGDVAGLTKARNQYLRVIVLYPGQSQYVSKSLYYAGLCFRQLADASQDDESKSRSRRMMRRVIADYPGSRWAKEAERYK